MSLSTMIESRDIIKTCIQIKETKMLDGFSQKMEFHINKNIREKLNFEKLFFHSYGNIILDSRRNIFNFVSAFNKIVRSGKLSEPQPLIRAGEVAGMCIIDEISHCIFELYIKGVNSSFFKEGFVYMDEDLQNNKDADISLFGLLTAFCKEFPPQEVFNKNKTEEEWLNEIDETSGMENKYLAMEELILLALANQNPAFGPLKVLFNDKNLSKTASYGIFKDNIRNWSKMNPVFGPGKTDIISMLKAPVDYSPYSLKGQLEYIKRNWKSLVKEILIKAAEYEDLIVGDEKDPHDREFLSFYDEPFDVPVKKEYFVKDNSPESNIVMISEDVPLWLCKLSKKYNKEITTLDDVPDEELDFWVKAGINAVKLTNIWEKSKASERIKQAGKNSKALKDSRAFYSYEISEDIGGKEAFVNFKLRTRQKGIKLAADMIPNYTCIDSKEVIENPEIFLQTKKSSIPSFYFSEEDLSFSDKVGI